MCANFVVALKALAGGGITGYIILLPLAFGVGGFVTYLFLFDSCYQKTKELTNTTSTGDANQTGERQIQHATKNDSLAKYEYLSFPVDSSSYSVNCDSTHVFVSFLILSVLVLLLCYCASCVRKTRLNYHKLIIKIQSPNQRLIQCTSDTGTWITTIVNHCYLTVVSYGESTCPVTQLVNSTWKYESRQGRDSGDLNHRNLRVRLVLEVTNRHLLQQYNDQKINTQESSSIAFPEEVQQNPILTGNIVNIEYGNEETQRMPVVETCLDKKSNEVYLFHGTSLECVTSIIEGGFDLRKARPGLYGKAIYLAESSEKADQYTDQINKRRKTGLVMLLVKVNLGHIQCFKDTPPVTMTYTDGNPEFDTVVAGFDKRFREFLVFDQNKTYPAFVVMYDRID